MANQEQLDILRQGVEAWNQWRKENPEIPVDLTDANLQREQLRGVDFSHATLSYASLRWADLSGANLKDADLTGVDMPMATIVNADLTDAWLKDASLWQSHFDGSNLSGANFEGTDIRMGFLNGATLFKTDFSEADLTSVHFDGAVFHATILYKTILDDVNLDGATIRADMRETRMRNVHLRRANLQGVFLISAFLDGSDLSDADLRGSNFAEASLFNTNLAGAQLQDAFLGGADLSLADLTGANLTGADISRTTLVQTNIEKAIFTGCRVYGCSVWDLRGEPDSQKDLIITSKEDSDITTDDIEVAQFIYLILNNRKIRDVLNTVTTKAVLILGRFADPVRMEILDALRDNLRKHNLLPVVFDFDRPIDRNLTETIKILAGMSYFVIADITSPKSTPLELQAIVPDYQIPIVPIIQADEFPFSMIDDLWGQYDGLLDPVTYDTAETLIKALKPAIIDVATERRNELRLKKTKKPTIRSAKDSLDKDEP